MHHIVPKCLGGSDEPSNLVVLSGREHFLAHYLLTKIYPDNRLIVEAFLTMARANKFQKRYINSRLYEALKKKRKELVSKKIVCLNNGCIFESTLDCSTELGINRKDIYNCLYKENHICCKGYYLEEYNANVSYTKEYCSEQILKKEERRRTNKVVCVETGEVYGSCHEFCLKLGLNRRNTQKILSKGLFIYNNKHYKIIRKADRHQVYRKVKCIETGKVYSTVKQASEETGISPASISRNILGKVKSAGGFHWERMID